MSCYRPSRRPLCLKQNIPIIAHPGNCAPQPPGGLLANPKRPLSWLGQWKGALLTLSKLIRIGKPKPLRFRSFTMAHPVVIAQSTRARNC